jgi:hypothetical protein
MALQSNEINMPISSFAWRIIYRFFVEGNTKMNFSEFYSSVMQCSYFSHLNISKALSLVLEVYRKKNGLAADVPILVFIGLDEFQKLNIPIPSMSTPIEHSVKLEGRTALQVIVESLGNEVITASFGAFCFALAGTEWTTAISIQTSSGYPVKRIPMPLLSFNSILTFINHSNDTKNFFQNWEKHKTFRRYASYLCNLPGLLVKFLGNVQ